MTALFLFCDTLLKKIRIITIDHKDAIFHIDSDMCIILSSCYYGNLLHGCIFKGSVRPNYHKKPIFSLTLHWWQVG